MGTTNTCKECINILPKDNSNGDSLVGSYRLIQNGGCPEGCSYMKDGSDPSDVWCMGVGDYQGDDVCPASSTQHMTTEVHAAPSSTQQTTPTSKQQITPSSTQQTNPFSTQQSTTTITTEVPPPPPPPPSTRIKTQYEEDGEVFEQEDTFN